MDAAGRTTSSTLDPSGADQTTSYVYGPDDSVATTTVTDATGATSVTDATYDPLGRQTSSTVHDDTPGHPVAWWPLQDGSAAYSPTTAADASGTQNTATLGDGATWTPPPLLNCGSPCQNELPITTAAFNGTSGAITAAKSAVDTASSFSVSAWVNLAAAGSAFQTIVSQDGTTASGFYLQYDATDDRWSFSMESADSGSPTTCGIAGGLGAFGKGGAGEAEPAPAAEPEPTPAADPAPAAAPEGDPAGGGGGGAGEEDPGSGGCGAFHSFSGSTLVLMAVGLPKPIDQIKAGDLVSNAAPGAKATQTHRVDAVILTRTDHDFVGLTVATKQGPKTITTTVHHLFYDVTTASWTEAARLKDGDRLQDTGGATTTVRAVRVYVGTAVTYDLTVDGLHTYFVEAGDLPVLVHNDSCRNVVLGINEGPPPGRVVGFADANEGYEHFVKSATWQSKVMAALKDPNAVIHVLLDDFDGDRSWR